MTYQHYHSDPSGWRDLFNELERWFKKEADGWNAYTADDGTVIPIMPQTIAAQLTEKWLTEVYQPALVQAEAHADTARPLAAAGAPTE